MNTTPDRRWPRWSLRTMFVVVTVAGFLMGSVGGLFYWSRSGMDSIFWGPLHFAFDGAPENQASGWILTVALVGAMLSPLMRRSGWAVAFCGMGIVGWLLLGILGWGINV